MTKIIPIGIVIFWLVMTSLFIRREIMPVIPQLSQPSYETVLSNPAYPAVSKFGIYYGSKKIGESVTTIAPQADKYYRITNDTDVRIPVGFLMRDPIKMAGYTQVTPDYRLDSFRFAIKATVVQYEISGTVRGEWLDVTINTAGKRRTEHLPYNPKTTISDGLSPFISMPHLTVGKVWLINYINPFSLGVESLQARVENLTKITWPDNEYEVYEVIIDTPQGLVGGQLRAYITPQGKILRQESFVQGIYLLNED
ncbi:MAG: hypothetical protein HY762_00660 [Planctomycetes bacterium]|nr:hypothetical protein [Planctomycetota bacterium]